MNARPRTAGEAQLKGLGLGFPVQVSQHRSTSVPTIKRVVSVSSQLDFYCQAETSFEDSFVTAVDATFDFPLPPLSMKAEAEQSYWSPETDSYASPAIGSPPSLLAHPALHLLSPKAQTMGGAAALYGVDETVDGALDFGWLVSAIDADPLVLPFPSSSLRQHHRPAPLMLQRNASISSPMTTSTSMSSSPSSAAPSMHRAASRLSAFSHASTAPSSIVSPPPSSMSKTSIMDRKNPLAGNVSGVRYFGSVPDLRARSLVSPVRRGSTQSTSEQARKSRSAGPVLASPVEVVENVEQEEEVNPRAAMLKVWLAAEAARLALHEQQRPLPSLPTGVDRSPVMNVAASRKANGAGRVKAWLGRLRRSPTVPTVMAQTLTAADEDEVEDERDWVREPRLHMQRTASIDEILALAMA